jgi:hypothetical protein
MWNFTNKPQTEALDETIDDLLSELKVMEGADEDYAPTTDNLIKLMKLKQEFNPVWRPSPDAVVGAVSSIAGILLILHYEKINVVASKALSFVGKMKN